MMVLGVSMVVSRCQAPDQPSGDSCHHSNGCDCGAPVSQMPGEARPVAEFVLCSPVQDSHVVRQVCDLSVLDFLMAAQAAPCRPAGHPEAFSLARVSPGPAHRQPGDGPAAPRPSWPAPAGPGRARSPVTASSASSTRAPGDDLGRHLPDPPRRLGGGPHDGRGGPVLPDVQQPAGGPTPVASSLLAALAAAQHVGGRAGPPRASTSAFVHLAGLQQVDAPGDDARRAVLLALGCDVLAAASSCCLSWQQASS